MSTTNLLQLRAETAEAITKELCALGVLCGECVTAVRRTRGLQPEPPARILSWITEARSDETRKRLLDQAVRWLAEGKPRNWKYMPQKAASSRTWHRQTVRT